MTEYGAKKVVPTGDYTLEVAASATDVKARFPLAVSGSLAETVNVVTANPQDVIVTVGKTVATDVRFALKDDRIFPGSAAKLAFASSDPSVATVCGKGVVTGVKPGLATISVTVDYKGSTKSVSFPIAVYDESSRVASLRGADTTPTQRHGSGRAGNSDRSPVYDRDALEEAIRIKVQGDDYDPATLAAYHAEILKAREVFFDPEASDDRIAAACKALLAVKANLRDYRYLVADFREANKTWHMNAGKSIWVNWARLRDADRREIESDFTGHDPKKLELRFTITLEPSDYRMPFKDAIAGGCWIKLRSRDVAQKDNDPDLQVFGGTMTDNNEHNYGWLATDFISDWGTTEVVIPLAVENPDGTIGLPFIDKGFKADGKSRYSRGKIDWATIDRIFMNFNFTDAFKKGASCTVRLADCRMIDVTLLEEREKLQALLDEKIEGGCDCPSKIALYENAVIKAREALAGENVVALRAAAKRLVEVREDVGYRTTSDKTALQRKIEARVRDFSRYTAESAEAYKGLYRVAAKVLTDKTAKQLAVNRALASLSGADELLRIRRVEPHLVATLLAGEKSVEAHGLMVSLPCDIDLAGEEDYDVTIRYEIKLESTHPNPSANAKWLTRIVNGNARVFGEGPQKNENAVMIAQMSCLRDSPMTAYEKPGTWMTLMHKIPVAQLKGAKLTRFETFMYNDGNGYVSDPDDGNRWNNDTGVKLSVRNVTVYTDRP